MPSTIIARFTPRPGVRPSQNFPIFERARRNGFEGSFTDFLRDGYVRRADLAPRQGRIEAPSVPPAPVIEAPGAASPAQPTEVLCINLGSIAAGLLAEVRGLEGQLHAMATPQHLRRIESPAASPVASPVATYELTLRDRDLIHRGGAGVALPAAFAVPVEEEKWVSLLPRTMIPKLRRRIEVLERELARRTIPTALRRIG